MSPISKEQHLAIELVQEITSEVVNNPNIRKAFCDEVRTSILDQEGVNIQPYRKVLSAVLKGEISDKNLSNYTLRNATWSILKVLTEEGDFTKEERGEIGRKVQQGGGKRGVLATQIVQGMKPLTDQEKSILDEIGKNQNPEYKRGDTRNIKKIMAKLQKETGVTRNSRDGVKHYMHTFNTGEKRSNVPWEDYPEEIEMLKDLFNHYYDPNKPQKKLPISLFVKLLNSKFGNSRNENSVGCYIRTHIKTEEQKQKPDEVWSDEEKTPLSYFLDKKEQYRIKKGKRIGKLDRELIYQEYKEMCPETKRTKRALEHKLKVLWEKNKK